MTTKTKQLAALINLALQKNSLFDVTTSQLLAAIAETEDEVENILLYTTGAQVVKEQLQEMLPPLSALLFALQNNVLNHLARDKYLLARTEMLYGKIEQTLTWYCYVSIPCEHKLLPMKKLLAQLTAIDKNLQQADAIQELYAVWRPGITELLATKKLPCHRWVWWSKCCAKLANNTLTNTGCFQDMLIKLNYNTPAFIHWLIQKLEEKIAAHHTMPHKLYCIMSELTLYELLPCPAEGYIPAERSVQEVMADVLQKKYNLLQNMPVLPAETDAVGAAKLHTALSVPQLALFVRLLVDTKVINENNNLALLRHVASVVSTEKAATPSPESLKVNYYTPGNAAKHIVKDYLLNMVNLLRRY